MSAVLAAKPLKRRTLERTGMTPEQELELLISEQQADDTHYVDTPMLQISLDSPAPSGDGTVGTELIGYDPWALVDAAIDLELDPTEVAYRGPLVSHLLPRRGSVLTDPRKIKHGTNGGYQNHRCRCGKCKDAYAAWRREYRQRGAGS